jgi:O-antigen/teichoic acid export membrane protein
VITLRVGERQAVAEQDVSEPSVHTRERDARSHLLRNGYALIANTGVTAALGLIYWSFAARAFDEASVGRASALVSLVVALSTATQCNLAPAFVRVLPQAGNRAASLVRRSYLLVSVIGLVAGLLAAWAIHVWGGQSSVRVSGWGIAGIAVSVPFWSLFALQDAALTSTRRAMWLPVENGLFGVVKVGLLLGLAATMSGRATSLLATTFFLPVVPLVAVVSYALFARVLRSSSAPSAPVRFRAMAGFAARDGLGAAAATTVTLGLPLLVALRLGAVAAASFYGAFLIVASLDGIAYGLSTSLTVEIVRAPERLADHVGVTLRRVVALVTVAVAGILVAAPAILRVLGGVYVKGAGVLRLLAVGVLFRAVAAVCFAVWRVQLRLRRVVVAQVLGALVSLVGGWTLAGRHGLIGVAFAVTCAQLLMLLLTLPSLVHVLRSPTAAPTVAWPATGDRDVAAWRLPVQFVRDTLLIGGAMVIANLAGPAVAAIVGLVPVMLVLRLLWRRRRVAIGGPTLRAERR